MSPAGFAERGISMSMIKDRQLFANEWYRLADLFDGPVSRLRDGSCMRIGVVEFAGSQLQLLTGMVLPRWDGFADDEPAEDRGYCQLTLQDVDRSDVDGLSGRFSPVRLLRENMLYVAEGRYAYDVLIRRGAAAFVSQGAVCVALKLDTGYRVAGNLAGRRQEVDTAYRRGLLDDPGKSRADFKLGIRPMLRKIEALRDSGYLPDDEWKVDVLFGYWHDRQTGELATSPFYPDHDGDAALQDAEIQFRERQRQRDFRISDLFTAR
jgi:hypothetical protein